MQAFSHPVSANHPHPLDQLTQELQQLRDQLAQVSRSSSVSSRSGEQEQSEDNLNQNSSDGSFLFPAGRGQAASGRSQAASGPRQAASAPPGSCQKLRSAPYASAQKEQSGSKKHTFLFGPSSAAP